MIANCKSQQSTRKGGIFSFPDTAFSGNHKNEITNYSMEIIAF